MRRAPRRVFFARHEPEAISELEEALQAAGEEKRSAAKGMNYEAAAKARIREIALADKIKVGSINSIFLFLA